MSHTVGKRHRNYLASAHISRTWKDKPFRLGERPRYYSRLAGNRGGHGKWKRAMSKRTRLDLNRQLDRHGDLVTRSRWQKEYFD